VNEKCIAYVSYTESNAKYSLKPIHSKKKDRKRKKVPKGVKVLNEPEIIDT